MALSLLAQLWPLPMPAAAKVVALTLADQANERPNEALLHASSLAALCGLPEQDTVEGVRWLLDHGFTQIVPQEDGLLFLLPSTS